MKYDQITPVILTYNEAPNIGRVLEKLGWAKDIVIVDSFSTDKTLEILYRFPNVRIFQRKFDSHAAQANYAVSETRIKTEWILSLDADYVLTDEFVEELGNLFPHPPLSLRERVRVRVEEICGYQASFIYCVFGKRLRRTLYPPRIVLFRRGKGKYIQDGHAHRFKPDGVVGSLKSFILHDDRKPFSAWFAAQKRYARLEAAKLRSAALAQLSWPDRIRKLIFVAPVAVLIYCLFVKGLALDGWPGIYYSFQRALAELLLSINLVGTKSKQHKTE